MIPDQVRVSLTGDYDRDVATLRVLLDRLPVFPIQRASFTSGTVGGAEGDYGIGTLGDVTHRKQEPWTDLVCWVAGSCYANTVGSTVEWHVQTYDSVETDTRSTAAFFLFNTTGEHHSFSGAVAIRGLPAGLIQVRPIMQVISGTAAFNADDRVILTIQEAIPYGLDGTT